MWYITSDLNIRTVGGFGHSFNDIISAIIIGKLYDLEYVHTPIPIFEEKALLRKYARQRKQCKNLIGPGSINNVIDPKWEQILGLISEKAVPNCQKQYIKMVASFFTLSKQKLDSFFSKFDRNNDILFVLTGNNRVRLSTLFEWNPQLYLSLEKEMQSKCRLNNSPLSRICVHIRRGDTVDEKLSSIKNKLNNVLQYFSPKEIIVLSYGSQGEMLEIKNNFREYNNVIYELNTDPFKCFEIMLEAKILLCGKSSFPKIASFYNNAIVIYIPLRDKYVPDETYSDRFIKCDQLGNFDTNKLINLLK